MTLLVEKLAFHCVMYVLAGSTFGEILITAYHCPELDEKIDTTLMSSLAQSNSNKIFPVFVLS